MHDVAVDNAPGDFFVLQTYAFNMVHFIVGSDLHVRHAAVNTRNLYVLHLDGVITDFLSGIIDMIELDFSAFKRLTGRCCFIEIGRGAINFLFNPHG